MDAVFQDVPKRDPGFVDRQAGFTLTPKCNCSISPAGLLGVFAALGAVSLLIGLGFAVAGAWLILPFVGLEIVALGAAFVLHARRVGGTERAGGEPDIFRRPDGATRAALASELTRRVRI